MSSKTSQPQSGELAEVFGLVREKGVEAIDLKFIDMPGRWHHVTIPASDLSEETFRKGIGFDASSISGFRGIESGDMSLLPDPETAVIDPFWDRKTLSLICNVVECDTKRRFPRDPRYVAQKAEEYLISTDLADQSLWSPEFEFHIFDSVAYRNEINACFYLIDSQEASWNSGEGGENLGHKIPHRGGYHAIPPLDILHNVRAEMVKKIEEAGVRVKYHHHEVGGPGQAEVEILFDTLTRSADVTMLIRYIIKMVAKLNGKTATFMPKPLYNEAGNGMHIHLMLRKEGKPIFFRKGGYADLSPAALSFIGGVLKHGRALAAFTNSATNSYKRLVPGYEAPTNLFFSLANRSAAIRIPGYALSPEEKRIEYRPSDACSNIYLALAAILMAGLDGMQQKIDPTKEGYGPFDIDLFSRSLKEQAKISPLPASLEEAIQALDDDNEFLQKGGVFSEDLIETWMEYKLEKEAIPIRNRPHPYEIELYYDV